jgi:hypothetical protein
VETERRSDEVTIYQMDDDGTVNRDNFVKMNVANRIKMRRQEGDPVPPAAGDTGGLGGGPLPRPNLYETSYYKRVEPSENVEIGRVDIIEKNPAGGGE